MMMRRRCWIMPRRPMMMMCPSSFSREETGSERRKQQCFCVCCCCLPHSLTLPLSHASAAAAGMQVRGQKDRQKGESVENERESCLPTRVSERERQSEERRERGERACRHRDTRVEESRRRCCCCSESEGKQRRSSYADAHTSSSTEHSLRRTRTERATSFTFAVTHTDRLASARRVASRRVASHRLACESLDQSFTASLSLSFSSSSPLLFFVSRYPHLVFSLPFP